MPMMKRVLGLDLGSHALKAVELRQTFRGLEPVQFKSQAVVNAEIPTSDLLRRFVTTHQLPTENVVCSIASPRVTVHQLEFPFRDRKRLSQTVPFQVEGQTPFDLEDILVDWELVGGEGRHAVVTSVLTQRREVTRVIDELTAADCEPRIIEPEGLVLGNLTSIFDLEGNRVLLDLGHSKTTACLIMDGKPVFSRSFSVGGRHVTEAISRDLGWSLVDAERWKCEDGIFDVDLASRSAGALEVLDRISRELVRTLESFERLLHGPAEAKLECITIVGGTARLHRLDEYLTGRTGILCVGLGIPSSPEGAALVSGGDTALYAPALALALRATAENRTQLNFRRDEFAYRTNLARFFGRDMRGTAIMGGLVAALFATSIAASASLESGEADQLESEVARIYASAFPGQAVPDNPVSAMSQAVHAARERADFLGVYEGNQSALDLLTELSSRIPSGIDVIFDEVTIEPKIIRIKVSGPNFEASDQVINHLTKEPPFQQAKVTSETKKVKDRVHFSVSIPLNLRGDES